VTQSAVAGIGKMENKGRYNHIGKSRPKSHADMMIKMPEYVPVHLAQR